jgi:hypothetical protein
MRAMQAFLKVTTGVMAVVGISEWAGWRLRIFPALGKALQTKQLNRRAIPVQAIYFTSRNNSPAQRGQLPMRGRRCKQQATAKPPSSAKKTTKAPKFLRKSTTQETATPVKVVNH